MTDNREQRKPAIAPVFHHTTFMTLKLDEMVDFYANVAGLEPVYYGADAAWLSNDEANHRIALLQLPGLKEPVDKPHTVGLHHTAFEYAHFYQWIENYIRLKALGITPFMVLDHGMTFSMYYADPEGNGVEIQYDTFGTWERSKSWMYNSREFSRDQIGNFCDPDLLVEAYESGFSPQEIHEFARADKYKPSTVPELYLPEVYAD